MKSFSEIVRSDKRPESSRFPVESKRFARDPKRVPENNRVSQGKSSESLKLCKYYLIGCPRIDCPHLHSISELKRYRWRPKQCNQSDDCPNDRRKRLSELATPCPYFHSGEQATQDEIINRLVEQLQPITKEKAWRNSQLCLDGMECTKRDCMWAHHRDELVKPRCVYGRDCQGWSCPFYHKEYLSIPWGDLDDTEPINYNYPLVMPYCPGDLE